MTTRKSSKKAATVSVEPTKRPSKTSLVLGLPFDRPAAEVITKAKSVGVELTAKQVYQIRSIARAKDEAPAAVNGVRAADRHASAKAAQTAEARFVDLALDVGLARAETLLARLRSRVKGLVLG